MADPELGVGLPFMGLEGSPGRGSLVETAHPLLCCSRDLGWPWITTSVPSTLTPPSFLLDRLLDLVRLAQYSTAQHVVPQAQEVVELATLDANGQLDSKSI